VGPHLRTVALVCASAACSSSPPGAADAAIVVDARAAADAPISLDAKLSADAHTSADARPLPDARSPPDAAPAADGAPGDLFLPWEGGPDYYASWTHALPTDPDFFPVAVFWQSAANADAFKLIGINTYIGFFNDADIAALDSKSMQVIGDQTNVDYQGLLNDAKLVGWNQQDEPDNAQDDGMGGFDPCIDPTVIQSRYATFVANDPSRPVFLNLGRGVAATSWVGRGTCTGHTEMYPEYAEGADVVSFDIYPVNSDDVAKDKLYYVADGVDRLRQAVAFAKPVYVYVETTDINSAGTTPTPAQIKSEVWMGLIHGARLVAYFSHIFDAQGHYLHDDGLLRTTSSKDAVQAIDAQIAALAPVLNTRSLANGATVSSSAPATPVDIMVKRYQGALYVFAVAMRPGATTATFTLRDVGGATAEVIGESRNLAVAGGQMSDNFAADYAVHIYKIP